MTEPLEKYYLVKDYDSQEEAIAAGIKPPPFDASKPIKTWMVPEWASSTRPTITYQGILRSEDGRSVTVEDFTVSRRDAGVLNVPPGRAMGGDDRIDASYALPVPLKPIPAGRVLRVGFGGTILVEDPAAILPGTAVAFTEADRARLERIETLIREAVGRK